MRRAAFLMWCVAAVVLPMASAAQTAPPAESDEPPALLVADQISVSEDNTLVAEGNVEVLYDGQRVWARRVIYDDSTEQITLEGPLRIEQADGTVITAASGEVDAEFREGLLRSARLVLDQQLQMSAAQLTRTEGRYSALSKVAVTSCQICANGRAPLWEIRARRIVHDDLEKQIYLDGATLRVLDVPVAYIPRLRFPDPTLKRAQGFLFPTLRSTSDLGLGIKIPYFIPIGDHKDLTLTPYLSPKTTTVEARYRQAFRKGDIVINSAVSQDALESGDTRAYAFLVGGFSLPRDFGLSFDIELATDDTYLREYGYASKTRLDSALALSKVTRESTSRVALTYFYSLRENETQSTLPAFILDAHHNRRLFPRLGGEVRLGAALHSHYRSSISDIEGRDVFRSHASALWRHDTLLRNGALFDATIGVDVDAINTYGDTSVEEQDTSVAPKASLRLRYPLVGTTPLGGRFVIEPVAQLGWTGGDRLETGNDESQRNEFDEGNLLALSRFSSADRRERGWALASGVRWASVAPTGWRVGLNVGRVVREETRSDFSKTSGLSEATSDWLFAGQIGNGSGLDLVARTLADDDFSIHRAEARGRWKNRKLSLEAAYLLLPEDADEDRDEDVSEWSLDASYRFSQRWSASGFWQYNLAQDRSTNGGVTVTYNNECVEATLVADRDFSDSGNVDPTTTFEFNLALKGFSTGGSAGGFRRKCSN